jgi:hypothetical protein
MVGWAFDAARQAWQDEGREGSQRLVGSIYFSLGDPEKGRADISEYYSVLPDFQGMVVGGIATTSDQVRQAVKEYEDMGVDEVMLGAGTDDLDEIARLAEIVL